MNTLLAGWAMGYAMAVASTVALVFLTVRLSGTGEVLDRWAARDVPRPLLAVPIFLGTSVVWTMFGLLLAWLYLLGDFGAEGSTRWAFAFTIIVLAVLPCPLLIFLARRYWWLWVAMSTLFAVLFAGAMPLLASR